MDFKEMIEKVTFLEKTQQKRVDTLRKKQEEEKKKEIEHIDFQSMDFEDLVPFLFSSVNFDMGLKHFTPPIQVLRDILDVINIQSVPIEEKKQASSLIFDELNTMTVKIRTHVRSWIFDKRLTPYKDSLRKIASGEQVKQVLSKKTEMDIIHLYLAIFKEQVLYYLDLITYDAYAKSYIPLVLKLAFIPGSRISQIKKRDIFDFILKKVCPEVTDPSFIHIMLKEYYQKEHLTFATPENLGDIESVKDYSLLLSYTQQKAIVERFIPICMDMIHFHTSALQENSDIDPNIRLNQLHSFKKDVEFLYDLQKGMTEDELK